MSLKENYISYLKNTEVLVGDRFFVSKGTFVFFTFLFFLNYFLVGAGFYFDFFIKTLVFTYILFLLSMFFLVYLFFLKYTLKKALFVKIIIFLILFIILIIFSLPFVITKGTISL